MKTYAKDKKVIEFVLSDLLSIAKFQVGGKIDKDSRYRLEEIAEFLAIYAHVKPENIEGWQQIKFEPFECCCTKHKRVNK